MPSYLKTKYSHKSTLEKDMYRNSKLISNKCKSIINLKLVLFIFILRLFHISQDSSTSNLSLTSLNLGILSLQYTR